MFISPHSFKGYNFIVKPSYKRIIFICFVFCATGVFALKDYKVFYLLWIVFIILLGFIYLYLKRSLIFYDDYIVASFLLRRNKRNIKLLYSNIKEVYYHGSLARGSDILAFSFLLFDKKIRMSYESNGNAPIALLKYLYEKKVFVYTDSLTVAEQIFPSVCRYKNKYFSSCKT